MYMAWEVLIQAHNELMMPSAWDNVTIYGKKLSNRENRNHQQTQLTQRNGTDQKGKKERQLLLKINTTRVLGTTRYTAWQELPRFTNCLINSPSTKATQTHRNHRESDENTWVRQCSEIIGSKTMWYLIVFKQIRDCSQVTCNIQCTDSLCV